MSNFELFDQVNESVKEDLMRVSDNPIIKNIHEELVNSFKEKFNIQDDDQQDRILLALDGRKNMSRINSDIDECISSMNLDVRGRTSLLNISTTGGMTEIRIRRS